MNENKLKEYDYLKNEINQKIELHNSLLTFTITTVVAVISFAFSQNNPVLFLIPFCIILPMSMRISYYRTVMAKISAYISVFLENDLPDMKWETRNSKISIEGKKRHKIPGFIVLPYYECLILSIISYALYIAAYLKDIKFDSSVLLFVLLPAILVVLEIIITINIYSINKQRNRWKDYWTEIKISEQ